MSNLIVTSPQRPYTFPDKFKAVSNGDVYAGLVDKTDLENPANQIQVYVVGEDGSETPVDQPLKINSGGLLVYNGQPSKFIVKQNYSMLVKQRGKQVMYEPNMAFVDPESAYLIVRDLSNSGDQMISGGLILPKEEKSAYVGLDATNALFLKIKSDVFTELSQFALVSKDRTGAVPSGEIEKINASNPPWDCVIGGVDFWMLDYRYYKISDEVIDVRALGSLYHSDGVIGAFSITNKIDGKGGDYDIGSKSLVAYQGASVNIKNIKITTTEKALTATGAKSIKTEKSNLTGDFSIFCDYSGSNQLTSVDIDGDCELKGKLTLRIDSLGSDVYGNWSIKNSKIIPGILDDRSGLIFTCRNEGSSPLGHFNGFEMVNCHVICTSTSGSGEDIINMGGRFKKPEFRGNTFTNLDKEKWVEIDLFDGGDDFVMDSNTFNNVMLKTYGTTVDPTTSYSFVTNNTWRISQESPATYCIVRRGDYIKISDNTFVMLGSSLGSAVFFQAEADSLICKYAKVKDNDAVSTRNIPLVLANGLKYSRITGNITPNATTPLREGSRVCEYNYVDGIFGVETSGNILIPKRNFVGDLISPTCTVNRIQKRSSLLKVNPIETTSQVLDALEVGLYIKPLGNISQLKNGNNGEFLTVQFGGTGYTVTHTGGFSEGGYFKLEGSADYDAPANAWIEFKHIRGNWVEIKRGQIS